MNIKINPLVLTKAYIKYLIAKYVPDKQGKIEIDNRIKFYKKFINTGDLYFDVGANMGNRTRPLLDIGAIVVAVEPQEKCFTFLKIAFGDKIKLVTKGLDAKETLRDFYISSSSVLSSFSDEWVDSVKDGRFKNYKWSKKEKVEMTTVDNLIVEYGRPKFIKIDVEGFELNVLKGLSSAVDIISFEYTVPEQTKALTDCIDQIIMYNKDVELNYSLGESMEFALDRWFSLTEMKQYLSNKEFIDTGFGDIYVKSKGLTLN